MNEYGSFITCPSCGFVDSDSWEFGQDSGETNCSECDIELHVEVYVDVTYTTTLVKGKDKNE